MKRTVLFATVILCVFAQPSRDTYREAYRVWREADPTLERDAATADPARAAEADRVANLAAKYATVRTAFLSQVAAAEEKNFSWLEQTPAPPSPSSAGIAPLIQSDIAAVRHSLDVYGSDPDPGIQQARSMLERENLALVSLGYVASDGDKAAAAVRSASAAEEQARAKARGLSQQVAAAMKRQTEEVGQEATAWGAYYRALSDDARRVAPSAAPTETAVPVPAPLPRQPEPLVTPLPLLRYVGAWTYPLSNGMFHGPQPEMVDVVVQEQNSHATGTLVGRFKVASGDPLVSFSFSGDFKDTRRQLFNLKTSDGARGTIELIPGPAFNLLEINFQIEPRPGKIHQGNFLLIKK